MLKSSDRYQQCHLEGSYQEYTLDSQFSLHLDKIVLSTFYNVDIKT